MSDSSSEDEVPAQLLEAVDKHFMNDSLFLKTEKTTANKQKESLPPSLRHVNDEDDQFVLTGLTKSTQVFIAKRLSEFLDKSLKDTVVKIRNHSAVNKSDSGGVLLFTDSVQYLNADEDNYEINCKKRKREFEVDEVALEKRCRSVAVSSDWILSGTATKGWSKSSRGEIVHVKKCSTKESNKLVCELIK